MNMHHNLIQELMLYKFELSNQKHLSEKWRYSWSQYSNQVVQEILLGLQEPCKNLFLMARSSRPKTMNFKALLQAIKANPASNTQRVSG